MIVTLELNPEEVSALTAHADAQGVTIETVLHDLVANLAKSQQTVSVIPAYDSPRDEAERAEIKANLDRWRLEQEHAPASQ